MNEYTVFIFGLTLVDCEVNQNDNKINSKKALLGNIQDDEVYEMVVNKNKDKAEKIFKLIDADNSNTLERTEIKDYLKKALGKAYHND